MTEYLYLFKKKLDELLSNKNFKETKNKNVFESYEKKIKVERKRNK